MQCSAGQFVINISLLCHCWRRAASPSVWWRSHFCKLWRGAETDAQPHRLSAVVALLQTLTRSVWNLDFSYFDIIDVSTQYFIFGEDALMPKLKNSICAFCMTVYDPGVGLTPDSWISTPCLSSPYFFDCRHIRYHYSSGHTVHCI